MRTLAIDTSLASGSVAALDGDRSVCLPLGPAGRHATDVSAVLTTAASRLGWRIRDVELVAVVRGPGSFTGLRVGVATAKAIAWTSGARLVAVSGFAVSARRTAAALGGEPPMAVAFDAGRGDVFAAWVARTADGPHPWLVHPPVLESFDTWLAPLPRGCVAAGPALAVGRERLEPRHDVRLPPVDACSGDALDAGRLALAAASRGLHDDPGTLVPEYLRPSYADERLAGGG
jgi:tRNA threonylcarbamoyladenosine biosynthesis protein TsaB